MILHDKVVQYEYIAGKHLPVKIWVNDPLILTQPGICPPKQTKDNAKQVHFWRSLFDPMEKSIEFK